MAQAQVVSNARGPYPQLEIVPVLNHGVRRHNTMPAQRTVRRDTAEHPPADSPAARSQARINRKLADVCPWLFLSCEYVFNEALLDGVHRKSAP